MGANAQTTVPTFIAGDVLTAAQMNQSARTGVPVFADSTARDAAFGGSGEKTLAEGQLCYLESTNVVQYYDGSSWATVGPQTLTSGLNFVTGATFTTATSFSLPNSTFTSTYRNYRIIVNITALTADSTFSGRMRASGTDNTTSNYNYGWLGIVMSTGASATAANTSQTSWLMLDSDAATLGGSPYYVLSFDLFQPQLAEETYFSALATQLNTPGTAFVSWFGNGIFTATTQFDSFSFISSVASSMTGAYRVYGYADS